MSEVLTPFRIQINGTPIYSGRAVLTNVVRTGGTLVCEAKLDECWTPEGLPSIEPQTIGERFGDFLGQWQKLYKMIPEYKVLIADMQMFLSDLRLWLQEVELGIRSAPGMDRLALEKELATRLGNPVVDGIDSMWHRFETMIQGLDPALHPVYCAYLRRQLHPLVLCSPFAYRAYHKPLGYAGDYEMVNMIARDPLEGASLFAKLINLWLWRQPPAEAHRNRLAYLETKLTEEAARAAASGRAARVFNVACGPAIEVQRFLSASNAADYADFTLLDFNQETIDHAQTALELARSKHRRRTPIRFVKRSVHQMLKESGVAVETRPERQYDLVYGAGLFDYLSDPVCQRLLQVFYTWVAPGGLLLVTNVEASKHFSYSLEFILDWHLVSRDRARVQKLIHGTAPGADTSVWTDFTGVNVFIEMRKPRHG